MFYLLLSFLVGTMLIRSAGFNSVRKASPSVVLEAPFRLMAGVLILVPGLISDILALLILIPLFRKALWTYFLSRIVRGNVQFQTWGQQWPRKPTGYDEEAAEIKIVRDERDVSPKSIGESSPEH
jgi:UPF0716 protein FxsA